MMKNERIPEHKLNVTTTTGQAAENIANDAFKQKGVQQNSKK